MIKSNEWRLGLMEGLQDRALERLSELNPDTPEFNYVLNNIGLLRGIAEQIKYNNLFDSMAEVDVPEEKTTTDEPVVEEPTPEPQPEPQPVPVMEAVRQAAANTVAAAIAKQEDKPALTLEEVRNKLIAYARAGVDLAALLQQLGCTKLSDVPADKYADLLESAEKASEGAN
jgi:hypothetical protein